LRTGQPGQAPEQRVIREYDINDYKEKTELTSQKLFTLMYATLRSYRDIRTLECSKNGLSEIVRSSASIFETQSMNKFARAVLTQLSSLLHLNPVLVYCSAIGLECGDNSSGCRIIAGTGEYENFVGSNALDFLDEDDCNILQEAFQKKRNVFSERYFASFFEGTPGIKNVLYVKHSHKLSEVDRNLIEVFCRNVSVAFSNVYLRQEIDDTQREIVYRLGEAVETRSLETGNHVKRVAEYSKLLARAVGIDEEEADIVRLASPMHDVGKVGIPDEIVHNPSKLEPEQWEIMKTHTNVGYEMLRSSPRRILKTVATIAYEHHEKWDGSGYPRGLAGEDIHIYGRIAALADVFDALGSDRCYKKAWPLVVLEGQELNVSRSSAA
jgi:putative nucleotidyltransferase with HDIG domain